MPRQVALHIALAVGVVAWGGVGCGGETYPLPKRPLVNPTPAGLAQWGIGTSETTDTAEAAVDSTDESHGAPDAPPARATRGAAGFTNAAELAAMEAECRALQPKDHTPTGAADGATTAYGEIFKGDKPVELKPLPQDNMFRWVEANPEYIDPNKSAESAGTAVVIQLFETLLIHAPGNTPPRPGAATGYEVSEDGRTYTFRIREGLVWSDGEPLTAHDFVYSWRRGLAPATASKNAQQLWFIKGAREYNSGTAKDPEGVAVRALDDHTLVVELVDPTPFFPELVTYTAYAPVPRHAVEAHGDRWTRVENIVSNGAFVLSEWRLRDRIVMTRNPRYWDVANVALDGTIIFISDDETRALRMYEAGELHYTKPLPPDRIRAWLRDGREDLHIAELMCSYYYIIRTDRPPFDDVNVRRALNQAIDKRRLTRHVLSSFETASTQLVPDMYRTQLGYVPPAGDGYSPPDARRLLAAADLPGGKLASFDVIYNSAETHKKIAEFATRNFSENLGLEIPAYNMEWKTLLKKVQAGEFAVARTSWCADYPDPFSFLEVFHSRSRNNYPKYDNPLYDELLGRIRSEADGWQRNVLICAAEKMLNRDVPIIPFYHYTRAYLLRPEVQGLLPQYLDHHALKWVSLKGAGG